MMARQLNRLSARAVATLAKPGRHADGGNLYLSISSEGARRWVFLYASGGQQRELGLGSARDVTLSRAREKAALYRGMLADGVDPLIAKRAEQAIPTFGEVAEKVIAIATANSRNQKHVYQWKQTVTEKAAALSPIRVDRVTVDDVHAVLAPLWEAQNETASRLRGRIERVLDYAKAKKWRSGDNPARWRGNLDVLLGARKKLTRGHHAAMPFADVPVFVADLRKRSSTAPRALEFLILTAARTGETIGATWGEIDFDAALWTIPGERMKAGHTHRVPLPPRAVEILQEMRAAAPKAAADAPIFPGPKAGAPMSNMALAMLLKRMAIAATPHGFRSSFRDWAGDQTAFSREVAEAALAHRIGDEVERAYRRSDALEKRRRLMVAWAGFVGSERVTGTVVPIKAER
jgi:integrase